MSKKEASKVGPYVIGATLGSGNSSKVKLGFNKETGEEVAVKIIAKSYITQKFSMKIKLEREIAIMKVIHHPHVLTLLDVYETAEYLYLILEYAPNGDFFEYLVKNGPLPEEQAFKYFHQLIDGLDYLHKHNICHRDLKPENILLDKSNNLKICDFGMASMSVDGNFFSTSCGSPHYASPEVIQGVAYSGDRADIWSCGVILYAMITAKLPFDHENIRLLLLKVKAGKYSIPKYISHDIQDLISRMLVVNPDNRITIPEIRNHVWFIANSPDQESPYPSLQRADHKVYELDNDIVKTLVVLGFGDEADVISKLTNKKGNYSKTFYYILEERKNRNVSSYPNNSNNSKNLSRSKSEKIKKFKIMSPRLVNSHNNNSESESPRHSQSLQKRLSRRISIPALISGGKLTTKEQPEPQQQQQPELHDNISPDKSVYIPKKSKKSKKNNENNNNNSSVEIKESQNEKKEVLSPRKKKHSDNDSQDREVDNNANDAKSMPSPKLSLKLAKVKIMNNNPNEEVIVSPRKSWLPSWLNTQNTTNGILSNKPLPQIKEQMQELLDSMQIPFQYSKKGSRIRAKYSKDGKSVKITIQFSEVVKEDKESTSEIYISFARAGDKVLYQFVVDNIKSHFN